jgi:ferredoxin-NADP reductase
MLKEELSPRLMILRVAADGWELPDFEPGQFTALGLPGSAPRCRLSEPENPLPDPDKLIRRAYSIASSSQIHEYRIPHARFPLTRSSPCRTLLSYQTAIGGI